MHLFVTIALYKSTVTIPYHTVMSIRCQWILRCECAANAVLHEGDLVTFGHPHGEFLAPGTWQRQPDSDFQYIVSSISVVCKIIIFLRKRLNLCTKKVITRDVKTVYFSKPVTGLPKPVFYRLPVTERRDNCHRSLRACYQSITCCFTAAVARIPDARTPSQRNKGQWRV